MGPFTRALSTRATVDGTDPAAWGRMFDGSGNITAAGTRVSPDTARQVATVWACQSLIADAVASLPVDTFRKTGGRRRTPTDNPSWIDTPNPFETPYAFRHKLMLSLLGEDGNAFVYLARDESGSVVSAWVLDPRAVGIDEMSPAPLYHVNGETFTDRDIIHIPAFTVPGRRRGLSVIDYAREAIGLAMAAEEFGARFFSQGTTMSGVIEHPGAPKPGEVAIMSRTLRKTHAGVKNSHAVGILTGGASWKAVSITPEQAQFLETRRFQNIEIAKLYRIPPHIIDPTVQSSWGSGVEEQNLFFAQYTLIPWLVRLEQAFSRVLPGRQYIKFNLDALLRAKLSERFQAYATGIQYGILSPDDAREREDYEPIAGGLGQAFYIPANLVPMGTPRAAPAPSPPDTDDATEGASE